MKYALITIFALHPFVNYILLGQTCSSLAFCGILFTIIAFMFFLKSAKNNIELPLNWFWLWALGYTMFLQFTRVPQGQVHIGFNYVTHITIFFLFYYAITLSDFDWKAIFKPLGYICMAMSLLTIMEVMGLKNFKHTWWDAPGPLGNPTDTAMYIAVTTPFLIAHRKGWLWLGVPIVAIAMLGSASAALGLYMAILAYFLIKRYWVRFSLWLLTSGVIWFFSGFLNPMYKVETWAKAMTDWKGFALFGSGLGMFEGRYWNEAKTVCCQMHNHYFYILYTLGVVGLLALLVWLIPILKNGWRYRSEYILPLCSVVAVLIMACCSIPMKVYPIALLTAFNLGIMTKEYEYE